METTVTSLPAQSKIFKRKLANRPERLVLLVHGIMSNGFWMKELTPRFESEGFIVKPIGYSIVDVFRFLYGRRQPIVETITTTIRQVIDQYPAAEVTVLAHSFGTYLVSRMLEKHTDIKINRLIMCGAVVPRKFQWSKIRILNSRSASKPVEIVNEHSGKDFWPILARHVTYGYGDVGCFGCQDAVAVTDRQHDMPHSGYLRLSFAEDYWIPLILGNLPKSNSISSARSSVLAVLNFLPGRLATWVLVSAFLFSALHFEDRNGFHMSGTFRLPPSSGTQLQVKGSSNSLSSQQSMVYDATEIGKTYQHKLYSSEKFGWLEVEVAGREPIKCKNEEDAYSQGTNSGAALKTVYKIDISRAYKRYGLAVLNFDYSYLKDENYAITGDQLEIRMAGRLDPSLALISEIRHEGDGDCIDRKFEDERSKAISEVELQTRAVQKSSLVKFLPGHNPGGTLLGSILAAFADSTVQPDIKPSDIIKLLRSSDQTTRSLAVESIKSNAQKYSEAIRTLVDHEQTSATALTEALRAASNAVPEPIALNLDRVIVLSYHDVRDVRDAARSYLRNPLVVSDKLASLVSLEALSTKVVSLSSLQVMGTNYTKDYLLLVAARDVHYSLGLKKLNGYLESLRLGEKADFSAVENAFTEGLRLRVLAKDDVQRAALSKNSYGLALAYLERAANAEALAKSSGESVFQYLSTARTESKLFLDSHDAATVASKFTAFLDDVGGNEGTYPWPDHIEQARRCSRNISHNCLSGQR